MQLVRLNEIKIKVYLKLYKDIFKGTDFGGEEELAIKKLCSGGIQGCDGKRCRLMVGWLSLMRRWTCRWTSRWEGMTKVNWSLELAVEEEKRRWRRLLATPGPSLVTASELRTPSLYVAASPCFEILPSAIVVILSSVRFGSEDISSDQEAKDYNTQI